MWLSTEVVFAAEQHRQEWVREGNELISLQENEIQPLVFDAIESWSESIESFPPETRRELDELVTQLRHSVDTNDVSIDDAAEREQTNGIIQIVDSLSRKLAPRPYSYRVIADVSLCGGLATAFACTRFGHELGFGHGAVIVGLGYLVGCSVFAVIGSALFALRGA